MKQIFTAIFSGLALSGAAMAGTIGPFDDGSAVFDPSPTPVSRWYQTRWSGGGMHGVDLVHVSSSGDVTVYLQADLFVSTSGNPVSDKRS